MRVAFVIGLAVALGVVGALPSRSWRSRPHIGTTAGTASTSPASEPTVQWVDPATLRIGPYQRDSLSEEQLGRVRRIHLAFAEVDDMPLEQRIDDFRRDVNLDRELAVWERMATAYSRYTASHDLSPEAKKEVYKVVLIGSMAPPDDVLAHLKLSILTEQEARDVMSGF